MYLCESARGNSKSQQAVYRLEQSDTNPRRCEALSAYSGLLYTMPKNEEGGKECFMHMLLVPASFLPCREPAPFL